MPSVWLGPIALKGDASDTNESQFATDLVAVGKQSTHPNRSRGTFTAIVGTARMTGNPWYMLADPNDAPVIEVSFLDGNQEPRIETKDGWDIDGAEIRPLMDFGVLGNDRHMGLTSTWCFLQDIRCLGRRLCGADAGCRTSASRDRLLERRAVNDSIHEAAVHPAP